MKHTTINRKIEILESINLGLLLENSKATTMSGDKLRTFIIENHASQQFNSITNMLTVASHCLASKDVAMIQVGTTILESIKSSIDARMIYCIESVQNAKTYDSNDFARQLTEKLEELIVLESVDEKLNSIRSGAISTFKTVSPVVDWVNEAAKITVEDMIDEGADVKAYHPVIFLENGRNEDFILRLANKVFSIKENSVTETVSPSSKFSYLSSIVEALTYNSAKNCFEHQDTVIGSFIINENGVFRPEEINEEFDNQKFLKEMSMINESLSNTQNESVRNQQVIDGMLSIHHNYENIVLADNILMVENKRNNEKYGIIVTENNESYVATLTSLRYPNTIQKFHRVDEAIELIKSRCNYDASGFFVKYLAEQHSADEKDAYISEKYNDLIGELEAREAQVRSKINEAKSNLQFNKAEALTESLVMIQSTIIEQKQNFAKSLFVK